MTTQSNILAVTQEARNAAKALWRPFGEQSGYFFNCRDDGLVVQAFARFEQQILSRSRPSEDVERLRSHIETILYNASEGLSGTTDERTVLSNIQTLSCAALASTNDSREERA